MKNLNLFVVIVVSFLMFFSCKDEKKKGDSSTETSVVKEEPKQFDDSDYVLNKKFDLGDVRRYGIFPDSAFTNIHPFTKESKFKTVLDLAENHGIELFFPEGFYGRGLILDARSNLTINFDKAAFNLIHITKDKKTGITPKNIVLKGEVISYDRLGMTYAEDISIDTVYIKSDIAKNKIRSRGCHIYVGCKNINIKYLEIDDLGSGGAAYKNNHAALAIDGYKNNPINVQIKKIHIKSSDRHGIYITGSDHLIGDVVIDKFGVGSSEGMSGMQDSSKGEEKEFKALWINRCYNSFIENITINEKDSKGKYTAHFDQGNKTKPFTIGTFKVINDNPAISVLKAPNTGVIIEIEE